MPDIDMGPDPEKVLVAGDWRPVVGSEGLYEAASSGRVRSLDRVKISSRGRPWIYRGRELKPVPHQVSGHLLVNIQQKTRYVHHLVLESFVGGVDDYGILD